MATFISENYSEKQLQIVIYFSLALILIRRAVFFSISNVISKTT